MFIQQNVFENVIYKIAAILFRFNVFLTLNVWGPSYLSLIRSISLLLMPWLLTSPGHQQPWYWLQYVGPGLTWGRILSTCVISKWSNDIKCKYMFMFLLQNLARKELMRGSPISGFVCIGYNSGLVKAFVVRRYVDDGSISVGEATDIWKDKDNVPVKVISWNRKVSIWPWGHLRE